MDDVLDFTADEAALGKPIGGDLREGKVTLPIILLLQRTDATVRALVQGVVTDRGVSPDDWRTLRDLLSRHHAVDAALL